VRKMKSQQVVVQLSGGKIQKFDLIANFESQACIFDLVKS